MCLLGFCLVLCCVSALIGRLFYPLVLTHTREPRFGLLLACSATWTYTIPVDNSAGGGTKNAIIAWNILDPTTPIIEAAMSSPSANWCVGEGGGGAGAAATACLLLLRRPARGQPYAQTRSERRS